MARAISASLFIIAIMIGFSLFGMTAISPNARIAVHWSLDGVANGFWLRDKALIFPPALAAGVSVLFALIPSIDPRKDNVAASRGLLLAGWIGILLFIGAAHAAIILSAAGIAPKNFPIEIAAYGAPSILIVIGNFIAKSKSNFFLGVRTPWTLSSEHAWRVANRAFGWMLVLTGFLSIAATAARGREAGLTVLLAGALASAAVSVALSYIAWRNDPEKSRSH